MDLLSGAHVNTSEVAQEAFIIDEHHTLDLSEAARQYAIAAVPMKPLCDQDCLGICSACGVNLRENSCKCDKAPRDSRWSPLLELLSGRGTESVQGVDSATTT